MGKELPGTILDKWSSVVWTWIPITFCLLIARLYVRVWLRFPGKQLVTIRWFYLLLSEFFVIGAWTSHFIYAILQTRAVAEHPVERFRLKLAYTKYLAYMFCVYCVKAAVICFYFEIIPKLLYKTWIAVRVLAVFTCICFLYIFLYNMTWCIPLNEIWDSGNTDHSKCIMSQSDIWFQTASMYVPHLVTDILIYILPFIPLRYMHNISQPQRFGAIIMFSMGLVSILLPAASFIFQMIPETRLTARIANFFMAVEQSIVVTVSCLPAFRVVIVRWVAAVKSSAGSMYSTFSTVISKDRRLRRNSQYLDSTDIISMNDAKSTAKSTAGAEERNEATRPRAQLTEVPNEAPSIEAINDDGHAVRNDSAV